MGYNLNQHYCHCWACSSHGLLESLATVTGLTKGEVFKLVGVADRRPVKDDRPRGKLTLPSGISDLLPQHRRYLKRRGFDPDEMAAVWGVRGIPMAAKLSWTLFIPIHDKTGEVASWTTRRLTDREPRYRGARVSEEAVSKRSLLYGEHLVPAHGVIVHEGPADCWRTGPGAVATLGVAYSRAQVWKLVSYPVRVVCFDNTDDGRERAAKLTRILASYPGKTARVSLEAKDAGSAGDGEIQALRRLIL